jgi:bacterioferritin-associated ferredoxin
MDPVPGERLMYVCHCKAVTDAEIHGAIADGATDEIDVAIACGAGTGCGSCIDEVRRLCGNACPAMTRVLVSAGD